MKSEQKINTSKRAFERNKASMRAKCIRKQALSHNPVELTSFTTGFNLGWKECMNAIKRRNKKVIENGNKNKIPN